MRNFGEIFIGKRKLAKLRLAYEFCAQVFSLHTKLTTVIRNHREQRKLDSKQKTCVLFCRKL